MKVKTEEKSLSSVGSSGVDIFRRLMAENKRTNGSNSFLFTLKKSLAYSSAELSSLKVHNIKQRGIYQQIFRVEMWKPDITNNIDSIALMEKLIQGSSSSRLNLIFDVCHHVVLSQFYARRVVSLCADSYTISKFQYPQQTGPLWHRLISGSEARLCDLRAYFVGIFGASINLRIARYRPVNNQRRFVRCRLPLSLSNQFKAEDWLDYRYSHATERLVLTIIGIPLSLFKMYSGNNVKNLVRNKLSEIFYSHCAIQIKYIIIQDIALLDAQQHSKSEHLVFMTRSSPIAIEKGKGKLSHKTDTNHFFMKLGVDSFIVSRRNYHNRLRAMQHIVFDT